ncbi:hypothetical protein BO94DRAFT_575629 [Aspergillus sclerotioniger CBS 115572]|uniref:Zn(2)-C6 fungal-type domain-containing protein n=1 Tax=Aspergillus sclerotioniger CBS 115572 TaxID=1450535 RepID=A0A317WNQ8_9EURO|nr:hypothetical protein BO94DRAFT_575629 [Aspergillus sclerotioniger CBS 115572]PWY86568.1 hypothetical protein BO94DRAFT_575629 [Aspergillus sclerotioniger CBS 115572]
MAPQRGRANGRESNGTRRSSSPSQEAEEPLATAACENCRTRKVRCDRQIPQCSNCLKAGVPCEFPNRGKRINHVKQLVEDVSGLASRLDSIDQAINTLVQNVSALQAASVAATDSSRSSTLLLPELSPGPDVEEMESIFYASYWDGGNRSNPRGVISSPAGRDKSLGHIGARSLFENSRRTLASLLEQMRNAGVEDQDSSAHKGRAVLFASPEAGALQSTLQTKYELYPFTKGLHLSPITGDGQAVASPPRSLLETCLPVYLEHFNVTIPVFNEYCLKEAINSYYTNGSSRSDEAYHLCFNNIIVLALGLRSRLTRMDRTCPKGMSDELLPAFLNNSFRAFQRLSTFQQPRLVCGQALATLAMVAREYHESRVFDTVCHATSQAVKSMGLQQCNSGNGSLSTADEERRDLYWAVFVMDKQRTYMAGRPFDLHFYDSDVQLLRTMAGQSLVQHYRTAHVHMMAVWEEIYIYLYSARAFRRGPAYRQSQIAKLDSMTRSWYARNGSLLTQSSSEMSALEGWRIELKYAFHIGQVLVHRFSSDQSSQHVALANSRAALRTICEVFQTKQTEASISLLARLFRHYPQVSIHGLFASFLAHPTADLLEDLDLIDGVAEALSPLCDANLPTSCLHQVNEGIQWYRDIAKSFQDHFEALPSRSPDLYPFASTRGHETSPTASRAPSHRARSDSPPQKRRRMYPTNFDDGNFLAAATNPDSSTASWTVPDERTVTLNSLSLPASNGSVPRLSSTEEHDQSSRRSSSSGSMRPIRADDELSKFLQDALPMPSASRCLSSPGILTAMGDAPSIPLPMNFFPSTPQGVEEGLDGGLYPFFIPDQDMTEAWNGDLRDLTVPEEFFLPAS